MHPFSVLGDARDYSRPMPLCPWRNESHIQYYAPVDNTQTAFDEFESKMAKWPLPPTGQIVLVSGEAGSGKTSLIHRCAHLYQTKMSSYAGTSIAIVDMTSDSWSSQASASKVTTAFDSILYHLTKLDNFVSSVALQELSKLGSRAPHIGNEIARALSRHSCVLILLLPQIETTADLDSITASLSLGGTILFIETTSEDVSRHCRQVYRPSSRRPVLLLSVGPLAESDGWTFVKKRLEIAKPSTLTAEEEGLRRYFRERTSGGGSVTVWGLERICYLLYQEGRVITYEAIASLFVQRGEIP